MVVVRLGAEHDRLQPDISRHFSLAKRVARFLSDVFGEEMRRGRGATAV